MMTIDEKFRMVKRAVDTGRPAQAYLITGALRGGAFDLAVKIVQYLFCVQSEKPCGVCDVCRRIAGRVDPDVHWFYPEKKSRIFGIEQMKEEILPVMTKSSFGGGWKAAVIVGADRMKKEAANAFLKTLEEPAPETLFLLLSDSPQEMLPTIVSRCQRIDLQDFRDLEEPWRGRVLEVLAMPSYGTIAERTAAAAQLSALLAELKDAAEREVKTEKDSDIGVDEDRDVLEAKISARYREHRGNFLMTLHKWFRDLYVLTAGGADSILHYPAFVDVYRRRIDGLTLAQACSNLERVGRIAGQFDANMAEAMVLSYWMDRITHGGGK